MKRNIALLFASALVMSVTMRAEYLTSQFMPELEQVPIARLIQNLEEIVRNDPRDSRARLNLARVHAMAYASKQEYSAVRKGREADGPWFGEEPKNVPFHVRPTKDAARLKETKAHLARAIELYWKVTKMSPNDPVGRLGYAWCRDQAGDKQMAVALYREVIRQDLPRERAWVYDSLSSMFVTAEAVEYLIPLLDPVKDRLEIATLRARVRENPPLERLVTPLVVGLRDAVNASDLVDWSARVPFDADGTGMKKRWTWISRNAGWLVYDPHGTEHVSSALQLFGNVTFWMFWSNGYEAMAALDDNRDGKLTGGELAGLAIWRDPNSNGVADPGEVASLAELGIIQLSCAYESVESDVAVAFSRAGVTFMNGATAPTYDVRLHRRVDPARPLQ